MSTRHRRLAVFLDASSPCCDGLCTVLHRAGIASCSSPVLIACLCEAGSFLTTTQQVLFPCLSRRDKSNNNNTFFPPLLLLLCIHRPCQTSSLPAALPLIYLLCLSYHLTCTLQTPELSHSFVAQSFLLHASPHFHLRRIYPFLTLLLLSTTIEAKT